MMSVTRRTKPPARVRMSCRSDESGVTSTNLFSTSLGLDGRLLLPYAAPALGSSLYMYLQMLPCTATATSAVYLSSLMAPWQHVCYRLTHPPSLPLSAAGSSPSRRELAVSRCSGPGSRWSRIHFAFASIVEKILCQLAGLT